MGTKKISALPTVAPTEASVLPHVTAGATDKATLGSLITTKFPATPRWDDLRVPAQALKLNPTKTKPDYSAIVGGVMAFLFDPTAQESVLFSAQLPHDYLLGSNLYPHVHYVATTTGAGTVKFGLEYTLAVIDSTLPATVIVSSTDSVSGEKGKHKLTSMTPIDGSAIDNVSTMLVCRLFRNSTADTYPADVGVLEFDFHYQKDSFGSASETVK